jgi:hypothetical protein
MGLSKEQQREKLRQEKPQVKPYAIKRVQGNELLVLTPKENRQLNHNRLQKKRKPG